MVSRNTFRSRLLALATGAGLAAGLIGITGAQAEQYTVGEVEITFDTTISVGASMRLADRENSFLPEGNGGRAETRPIIDADLCDTTTFVATSGAVCAPLSFSHILAGPGLFAEAGIRDTTFADNFDGSINSDDGRLNYDNGDLIGAPLKATHDIQATWRNFTAFVRASYFYDAVLDDGDSASRYPLGEDVTNDIGRGFDILDAYVSADFDVGSMPVTFRQGYQVINWGEATFFLNGISSINPIDVGAIRRPGSEIKEAFIPVHASFIQVGLPNDFSLEAFYQWEWRDFVLDPAGSPYGGSDSLRPFAGTPVMGGSLIGGSPTSGSYRRNCDASAVYADPLVYGAPTAAFLNGTYGSLGVLNQISLGLGGGVNPVLSPGECGGTEVDMRYRIPIGMNEEVRMRNGDLNYIPRLADQDPDDGGEFGVAVRYYADWLNATEFGFYFTNTHSRLPYAQLVPGTPQVGISSTNDGTSAITRQIGNAGCLTAGGGAGAGFIQTGVFPVISISGLSDADPFPTADPSQYAITGDIDPNGYLAAVAPIADAILAGATFTPGFTGTEIQADVADADGASMLTLMQINCALLIVQSGVVDFSYSPAFHGGLSDQLPTLATGAETINFASQHGLRFQYPEDIRMYGMSFNTTIGSWGVQGELAYRDNMPLQIDTNSLTIISGLQQCAFLALTGDVWHAFESQAVEVGNAGNCDTSNQSVYDDGGTPGDSVALRADDTFLYTAPGPIDGFIREEVLTGDFGTTATYSASNPFVNLVGADLGIFLTEVGFAYVPDAPAEGDFTKSQLIGASCQGSDLPLGGLLSLDSRRGCRPDEFSWGYLLIGRLDYNNVFGAFTLSPTVVFSHDVEGTSPAPITNYVEDTMSLSLSVGASYQSTWRASVGYNSFFGGGIANKSRDKDFASISLSYSF